MTAHPSAPAARRLRWCRPRLASLLLGAALAVPLATPAALPGAPVAGPAAHADHAHEHERGPGPVHAGNTFGWWWGGGLRWREEFEVGELDPDRWRVAGDGVVRHQHGMLTLDTTTSGSVSAQLRGAARRHGRWEIRMRSKRFSRGDRNFSVVSELVPARGLAQHCGARDLAMESYRIGRRAATLRVRNLPDTELRARVPDLTLGDAWHTWAVEVTPERVSWFVDAHVVRTEERPEALSGVRLVPRFTLQAVAGETMNPSRMQLDWVRHWSLAAPNTLPVEAPAMRLATHDGAC